MTLKTTALTIGAVAFVGTGALFAQEQNPFIDRGSHFELPITNEFPQGERVEIAKDRARMDLFFWNDEYAITIEPHIPSSRQPFNVPANRPLLSKRMEYKSGDVTAFIEQRSDNEFDIDFTLDRKPNTNVFEYSIEGAEDFDFFFQPELTQEEIDNGAFRPENVVGSYAVYHKTKKDHTIGETNYATGKAFHIYRPKAIDDNGDEVWAELSYTDGILSVTVPQDFLDSAEYPVVVDPTVGFTGEGGSTFNTSGVSAGLYASNYNNTTDASGGDVTDIQFYGAQDETNIDVQFGMYDASDNLLSPQSSSVNVNSTDTQWWVATFAGPTLSASTVYKPTIFHDDNESSTDQMTLMYDSGNSGDGNHDFSGPTFPTWPDPADFTAVTNRYSIYATYTATASSGFDVRGDIEVHGDAVYRQ